VSSETGLKLILVDNEIRWKEAHMEQSKESLLDQLLKMARSLPADKIAEVLDFAAYLRARLQSPPSRPERGSPQALLRHAGVFRLASGELDRLLSEIAQMRALDMEGYA
jgi:hypothetical protein